MDDREEYTVNDDLRACGLPADDDDDLTAGAEALFGSSVAPINVDAPNDAGVLEVMASARRRLRRRPRRLLLLLPTTSC